MRKSLHRNDRRKALRNTKKQWWKLGHLIWGRRHYTGTHPDQQIRDLELLHYGRNV